MAKTSVSDEIKILIIFIILALAVLYVVSPLDIVPDIIPILGWIDDVLVLTVSIATSLLILASIFVKR